MARKHRPVKLKSKCKVENDGTERWFSDGEYLHRSNGLPAILYPDGSEFYLENNQYHRENGPAIVVRTHNGLVKDYYLRGQEVNENGEAIF